MVRDAENNAVADHALRLLAEARNTAEGGIHSVRKALAAGAEAPDGARPSQVEALIAALEKALAAGDLAAIGSATQSLHDAAAALQQAPASAPPADQPGNAGEAIDAQFEDVSR